MGERVVLRKDWLAPLIHSLMATGTIARMCNDAIQRAYDDKRPQDVTLYRNIKDQIADYYAQRDDQ